MAEWINSYEVVESETASQLSELVTQMIAEGWQPWGSPYVIGDRLHCQALVRTQEGLRRQEGEKRRLGEDQEGAAE